MELDVREVRSHTNRRIKSYAARLAAVAMIAGLISGVGATPASASHGATVCVVADGSAELDVGLYAPELGPPRVAVAVSVSGAVCVDSADIDVTITVTATVSGNSVTPTVGGPNTGVGGWCGQSTGSAGVTVDGVEHVSEWVSAGTQLVFVGPDFVGSVNAVVDAAHPHSDPPVGSGPGNSCRDGTAHHFKLNGAVVLPGPVSETTG